MKGNFPSKGLSTEVEKARKIDLQTHQPIHERCKEEGSQNQITKMHSIQRIKISAAFWIWGLMDLCIQFDPIFLQFRVFNSKNIIGDLNPYPFKYAHDSRIL